jgi:O-antigen/teichoic acid export membrane protein
MRKMIIRNYFISLVYPFTTTLTGLFITNYLAKGLGINQYGQFLAYAAFFTIATAIADFQLQYVLVKKYTERELTSNDFWLIVIIKSIPISIGMVFCIWQAYSDFQSHKAMIPYLVLGASLIFIPSHFDWYLIAKMRFAFLSFIKTFAAVLQACITFALVQFFPTPMTPLLAQLIVFIAYAIFCVQSSNIKIAPFKFRFEWKSIAIIKSALLLAITQVICTFGFNYATILVYKYFPNSENSGFFASSQKLSLLMMSFSIPLINVFIPILIGRNDFRFVKRLIVYPILFSAIGIILFYFLGINIFYIIFGIVYPTADALNSFTKLMIILIGSVGIFSFARAPSCSLLFAKGFYLEYCVCNGLPALIGFFAMSIFAKKGNFNMIVYSAASIEIMTTIFTIIITLLTFSRKKITNVKIKTS